MRSHLRLEPDVESTTQVCSIAVWLKSSRAMNSRQVGSEAVLGVCRCAIRNPTTARRKGNVRGEERKEMSDRRNREYEERKESGKFAASVEGQSARSSPGLTHGPFSAIDV